MGKFKHYKGDISGGVDISHKSKMSGKAKNLMSFPGGMPGPGEYGSMNNKVVGKGMIKYMAGEPVGMAKYKSDAQRKAAHASMAEKGAGKYGKHMGPEKAKTMVKGPDGKMVPDYAVDGKGSGDLAPKKHGKHKGPKKTDDLKAIQSPRQKRLAKEKADEKKKSSDLINKKFKGGKLDLSKSSGKKSMSDGEKIKASKAKKEAAGNKKKAEGQADLKKAKEMKFISRGSGEDSGIATREERRKAIRAARAKKRAGRKEARKARKKTVIKQKI